MKQPISKWVKHFYSFGPFRLYVAERELFHGSDPVDLAPRALKALIFLLDKRGHVVEKQELMRELWPDTFVEDGSLSKLVSQLRKVPGNRPDGKPYIETIPKRGYRLGDPVIDSWESEEKSTRLEAAPTSAEANGGNPYHRFRTPVAAVALLTLLAGVIAIVIALRDPPATPPTITPLTTLPGEEWHGILSPDGTRLALPFTHK